MVGGLRAAEINLDSGYYQKSPPRKFRPGLKYLPELKIIHICKITGKGTFPTEEATRAEFWRLLAFLPIFLFVKFTVKLATQMKGGTIHDNAGLQSLTTWIIPYLGGRGPF